MKLSKQIRLGFGLMLILMIIIGGLFIYNVYRLNDAASNIEGRYSTLYKLFSNPDNKIEPDPGFGKEIVDRAVALVDEQLKYNYTYVMIIVGVSILFAGIITVLFPAKITRPIERLINATKTVKKGDYSYRIKSVGEVDEISILAGSFNEMLQNIEDTHRSNLGLLEQTKRFNETLKERVDEATSAIRDQQNELIKAERLATIGEFAARIAHEIKNPLSGITVALEIMRSKSEDNDQQQSISEVLKEVRRLDRILKDLLQLSIPKEMDFRRADPNDVVERSVLVVSPIADEKGVTIETNLNCTEEFNLDFEKCQQVVINLLINGLDALETGEGKVTVETDSLGGELHIRVTDTGHGISPHEMEKVFEPFYTSKKQGTGLGLAISKRIIEAHNGSISVSSEVGTGSAFTVVLPRNPGERAKISV
ncbi:MAG TPA: ATP-binding protein [Thermodesulfobacteriota bacterium]|nr:ATP-binding protein [Thermodesulfobacteriota bacterium]